MTGEDQSNVSHDATTGFHDIKAIPRSRSAGVSDEAFFGILLGAAAMLLAVLLRRIWRRRKGPIVIESPEDRLRRKLRRLREERIRTEPARVAALEISEAVRSYLEEVLRFPAAELTPAELRARLSGKLAESFPAAPDTARLQLNEEVYTALKKLERITFGTDAVHLSEAGELPALCEQAERVILGLETLSRSREESHAPL